MPAVTGLLRSPNSLPKSLRTDFTDSDTALRIAMTPNPTAGESGTSTDKPRSTAAVASIPSQAAAIMRSPKRGKAEPPAIDSRTLPTATPDATRIVQQTRYRSICLMRYGLNWGLSDYGRIHRTDECREVWDADASRRPGN